MSVRLHLRLIALLVLLAPEVSFGATTCTVSASNVTFGSYDVFRLADTDAEGVLVVTCDRAGGAVNTTLDIGIGPSATSASVSPRAMGSAATRDTLLYNLFSNAARTVVWGNTPSVDTVRPVVSPPNKGSQQLQLPVYGRIPAGQDVSAGGYSDSLVITVTP